MALNIKNERVYALAREAARRTGGSMTSVIEEALARFLREMDDPQDVARRLDAATTIARNFEARLSASDRERLTTESLYDEHGLPA